MRMRIVLCTGIVLCLAGALSADTDFTEAVDNLWSNVGNWSAGFPDDADKANFRNGVSAVLDYNAGIIKNLAIEGGASKVTLVDGAELAVRDWSIVGYNGGEQGNPHILELLGGLYNANARLYVGYTGFGLMIVDNDAVLNINAQTLGIGQEENGVIGGTPRRHRESLDECLNSLAVGHW